MGGEELQPVVVAEVGDLDEQKKKDKKVRIHADRVNHLRFMFHLFGGGAGASLQRPPALHRDRGNDSKPLWIDRNCRSTTKQTHRRFIT